MATYRIGSSVVSSGQPNFSQLLEDAYKTHVRPHCLCNGEPGSPMYIACVNNAYYLKRMPNTGKQHSTNCTSWDIPDELSGLADMIGSAVTYEEEKVVIKLGFPLSKLGSRNAPDNNGDRDEQKLDVDGNTKKMSMHGLLNFLWSSSGLSRWSPDGPQRNWSYVYPLVTDAAERIIVHNAPLSSSLFIPEPFYTYKNDPAKTREMAEKIELRRRERFRSFDSGEKKKKKHLMVVVGELKGVTQNGMGGHQVTLKQLPDYRFLLSEELFKNIHNNWSTEISMWTSDSKNRRRIILGATCAVLPEGVAQLEKASLMLVNDQWVPFDTLYQEELLTKLIAARRSFTRHQRYNHVKGTPMPVAWLNDAGEKPIAMYIVADDEELQRTLADTADSTHQSWFWNISESIEVPAFPVKAIAPVESEKSEAANTTAA